MKAILIIQTAFIGDVVLATSLLEKLHMHYPGAKLDFLVRKGNETLFTRHPYLNSVLVWDKKQGKYKELVRLHKQIRQAKYDLVVNVQRFAATGFLAAFSGAKQVIGYDKNPLSFLFTKRVTHRFGNSRESVHEIDRCNDLIAAITDVVPAKPRLYPSMADYARVSNFQQEPYIVVAPGSVWFTKQFPLRKWIRLLSDLPVYLNVIIIGAAGDTAIAGKIKEGIPGRPVKILTGQLSYLESTALMESAMLNVVNDSAPLHFASARNAPTAALYCSTVPAFGFGPLADESHIIESRQLLSCRPCGLHGKKACPNGHFKCAHSIDEQEIVAIIENKFIHATQL